MRPRKAIATLLCVIAALSAIQTLGVIPSLVFAENTLTVQLNRLALSSDPLSGSGKVLINLDDGQTKVELHNATPNATYAIIFVSTSVTSTLQLTSLVTGFDGTGQTQTTLNSGNYEGAFSVTRLGILQYSSNNTLFSIGLPANVTRSATISNTTQTSTQTIESETTSLVNSSSQTVFQIQPLSSVVNAGDFAKYDVRIVQNPSANVFLVAQGVPPDCVAIFTPSIGVADPEFHSKLTIATSANTPAGSYNVAAIATIDGKEFTDQVTLQINPPVSIPTTLANSTMSAMATLTMAVSTDNSQYQPNTNATVQGHVRDNAGNAVSGATITIQVDAPNGAQVFYTNTVNTDTAGFFQIQLTLPSNAPVGTFTVFGSASKSGYVSATTRSTFVVGVSRTPSVIIKSVYAGDSVGNPLATFTIGQTIWIWVVIQNIGSTFQGVVWIQVRDPNGVPVQIQIHVANLDAGETIKDGLGFTMASNAAVGVYTVNALVSDKLISQGGTFLANADTQFDLVR
ncbi:MAG TPA: MG2 domain-containing protein [Terriglobales bacterium]|nr:MG2 domain-containing protein [Terriglobales bacterium]